MSRTEADTEPGSQPFPGDDHAFLGGQAIRIPLSADTLTNGGTDDRHGLPHGGLFDYELRALPVLPLLSKPVTWLTPEHDPYSGAFLPIRLLSRPS